ncbi:MAG TPA: ferrous iron transport protein A [Peptococcaceae bacterium]|jgi:ferrous iron transport protein A|nr:ferrous iron transport protein A [Peptococcaceae bacterium]
MSRTIVPLSQLSNGASGRVAALNTNGRNRRHLLDLGLVTGSRVEAIRRSPAGDPAAFNIKGAIIALRSEVSDQILVSLD